MCDLEHQPSCPSDYGTLGYTGHIPGLRDQVGSRYGQAVTTIYRQCGPWTGPCADRPAWSTGSRDDLHERPSWVGRIYDDINRVTCPTNFCCVPSERRLPIDGKQYMYPCRPEACPFPRPRHVSKIIDARNFLIKEPLCEADDTAATPSCQCKPPGGCAYKSPYNLPDDHPDKFFILGYAGHVPYFRDFVGTTANCSSRLALNKFGPICPRSCYACCEDRGQSRHVQRPRLHCPPRYDKVIYPVCSGMVGAYAGHIPGYRSRDCGTFGRLTHDSKSQIRKIMARAEMCKGV